MDEKEWLLERYNAYKDTIKKIKEEEVEYTSTKWLVNEMIISTYKRFIFDLDIRLLFLGYDIREADSE